jgi:hypothetical protein
METRNHQPEYFITQKMEWNGKFRKLLTEALSNEDELTKAFNVRQSIGKMVNGIRTSEIKLTNAELQQALTDIDNDDRSTYVLHDASRLGNLLNNTHKNILDAYPDSGIHKIKIIKNSDILKYEAAMFYAVTEIWIEEAEPCYRAIYNDPNTPQKVAEAYLKDQLNYEKELYELAYYQILNMQSKTLSKSEQQTIPSETASIQDLSEEENNNPAYSPGISGEGRAEEASADESVSHETASAQDLSEEENNDSAYSPGINGEGHAEEASVDEGVSHETTSTQDLSEEEEKNNDSAYSPDISGEKHAEEASADEAASQPHSDDTESAHENSSTILSVNEQDFHEASPAPALTENKKTNSWRKYLLIGAVIGLVAGIAIAFITLAVVSHGFAIPALLGFGYASAGTLAGYFAGSTAAVAAAASLPASIGFLCGFSASIVAACSALGTMIIGGGLTVLRRTKAAGAPSPSDNAELQEEDPSCTTVNISKMLGIDLAHTVVPEKNVTSKPITVCDNPSASFLHNTEKSDEYQCTYRQTI